MNKKLISLILASMALGALAGCGGKKPDTPSDSGKESPTSETTPSETTPSEPSEPSEPSQPSESEEALPDTYSLMKYWAGNPGEEFYTVTENTNNTIIDYEDVTGEDAGGWAYVSRSFAYDAAVKERFGEYKKISFTGKLEKTSGTDIVMVKVEGTGVAWEKKFNFSSTENTYEFSLNFVEDWSKVNTLLFFVNRGTNVSGTGTITLTKMELSKENVDSQYDIAPGMPDVPQGYTYYNDADQPLSVMYRWGYNAEEFFTTTEEGGAFTFSWEAGDKTNPWSFVSAKVKDGDKSLKTSGFKRLHFEFNGTSGKTIKLKIEADTNGGYNKETDDIQLNGATQSADINVVDYLANSEVDAYKVIIFIMPNYSGPVADAGAVTLTKCVFDYEEAYVPRVENDSYHPAIFLDKPNRIGDPFTYSNDGHVSRIHYKKDFGGYDNIQYFVHMTEDWFDPAEYTHVYAVITADVNVRIILKAYDSHEKRIDLVANEPYIADYSFDSSIVDLDKGFYVFICVGEADHEDALEGNVTIEGLRLARENTCFDVNGEVILNKLFAGDGVYTGRLDANNDLVVDYALPEAGYRAGQILASGINLHKANQLEVTLLSTVDTHVLLKPADNNGNEKSVALTAGEETVVSYTFENRYDVKWGKTVFFIATNEGDGLEGSVTFKGFKVYYSNGSSTTENVASYASVYLDNFSFVGDGYMVSPVENGNKISYNFAEGKNNSWSNLQAKVTMPEDWWDIKNFTRVTATIVADVDVAVLFKAYDNNAGEQWVELKANEPQKVRYIVDANICDLAKPMVLFACVGDDSGAASGNITITDLRLSWPTAALEEDGRLYVRNIAVASDDYFDVEHEDGLGLSIVKNGTGSDSNRWAGFQVFTSARDHSKIKHMHVKVSAERACRVLVKPNDSNEKVVEVAAANTVVEVDLEWDNGYIDEKWVKTIIIIDAGEGDQDILVHFAQLYFY